MAAVVSGALLAFAPSALAEPTPQDKEHARDLMADGRDKRDRDDLAGALESFQQADAIMHVPTTGYEVAKTQELLGKLLEARATVDAIAKLPISPNDPPPFGEARTKAEALAKELDGKLGHLEIVAPPGARVAVDDMPIASLEAPVHVTPGPHVVTDGDARVEVTVLAGETKDVTLIREPKVVARAPEPPKKFPVPTLSLIGFGVGAAGLAVGAVTGVMAIGDEGDISERCGGTKRCDRSVEDDLDAAKTKATISTVGFIVAGVGVAVGVAGFFLTPKTEAKVGAVTIDFARMRATF